MIPRLGLVVLAPALAAAIGTFACSRSVDRPTFDDGAGAGESTDTPPLEDVAPPTGFVTEAGVTDAADASFETCAATAVEATRERLPVDIIWIVDNSSSMQPAVTAVQSGLNDFATLIGGKGIDYKVVMLSLRGSAPLTGGGSNRYPVCIPPPLGGATCGNAANFFHAAMDVKSTQPLEQFLGTLGQTAGYTAADSRGSEPWSQELRPNATKSIVVVTDDNSRFTANSFETFPGGKNPSNSTTLPPGVLHASRGDQFKGYVFSAIYGWGSTTIPSTRCTYGDGTLPASPGEVYTDLVAKTGGVRAKICDGSTAWGPFFDGVATAVLATSRVACELEIPQPDAGLLDADSVNVRLSDGAGSSAVVPRVKDEASCGTAAGWYYDDPTAPSKVILCSASCEGAQSKGGADVPKVEVLFGCKSVVK